MSFYISGDANPMQGSPLTFVTFSTFTMLDVAAITKFKYNPPIFPLLCLTSKHDC
jgi:hypothetical protein